MPLFPVTVIVQFPGVAVCVALTMRFEVAVALGSRRSVVEFSIIVTSGADVAALRVTFALKLFTDVTEMIVALKPP